MTIKGLKEALAKKQAQHHPDGAIRDSADPRIMPTVPVQVTSRKPQKKAIGRGR